MVLRAVVAPYVGERSVARNTARYDSECLARRGREASGVGRDQGPTQRRAGAHLQLPEVDPRPGPANYDLHQGSVRLSERGIRRR